jgi:glutathione S-transferase
VPLTLLAHPFSCYCWKVLIALYEQETRFSLRPVEDAAYGWLETRLAGDAWASGPGFTLADCGGAPALFYADWVHPLGQRLPRVQAYRSKVLARPSVARVVDEARPYRHFFPGGAPDRD